MEYLDVRYIASYVSAGLLLATTIGLFRAARGWTKRVNTSMSDTATALALLRQQLEDHITSPGLHRRAGGSRNRNVLHSS